MKGVVAKQGASVTMKAVRAELLLPRVVFGHKKLESAFLFVSQLSLPANRAIEFRIERGQSEHERFEGDTNSFGRNLAWAKSVFEKLDVVGVAPQFCHQVFERF